MTPLSNLMLIFNYSTAGGRGKQILQVILGHTW